MQTTQQRAYFKHSQTHRACQRKKQRHRKKRVNRQRQQWFCKYRSYTSLL